MKRLSYFLLTSWLIMLTLAACSGATTTVAPAATALSRPDTKVDSILQTIFARYQTEGLSAIQDFARQVGLLDELDRVRFAITLTDTKEAAALSQWLQNSGAIVTAVYKDQISARVSFNRLKQLANNKSFWQELSEIKTVKDVRILVAPPQQVEQSGLSGAEFLSTMPRISIGGSSTPDTTLHAAPDTTNQGVAVVGAEEWHNAGIKGKGVKIGIIDGGFYQYGTYLGGALPDAKQVTMKSFIFGGSEGKDLHGVAVTEIINSYAPEAQYYLAPIEDEIGFAQAVDWMMEQGVQIIHVSLAWGGLWAGDGSGLMNERINAAREKGALPVVSAGNYAQSHFMTAIKPDANNFHSFGEKKNILKLTPNSTSTWVALRWEETWNNPKTNLDLYVLDENYKTVASSRNVQGEGSTKPPTELAVFATKPNQSFYLQVRVNGQVQTENLQFHLFAYNATLEESNASNSVATPGDAKGALSVGATYWQDDSLEGYSSRGPTTDGRFKPELVAPSRVNLQVFAKYDVAFSGTSAAAPQVSGASALLWCALPELKVEQVVTYLQRNAKPPPNPPTDQAWGYGRLQLGSVAAINGSVSELLGSEPIAPSWQDTFRDISGDLPDNINSYYGKLPDGTSGYFVQSGEQGIINWSTYQSRYFEEFRAEFSVSAPTKPEPAMFYGLIFWQQSPINYYLLGISENNFAILQRTGDNWTEIVGWQSNAMLSNRPVHLSLEATKGYIRVKAGNTLLKSVPLPSKSITGGKLGFAAGIFSSNNVVAYANDQAKETGFNRPQVVFSNLIITPLTS